MEKKDNKTRWVKLKFLDDACLVVPHDVLANAKQLSLLARKFAHENESMLDKNDDGCVLMYTLSTLFKPLLHRLIRPTLPLSHVPESFTISEWFAELDYWGYQDQAESLKHVKNFHVRRAHVEKRHHEEKCDKGKQGEEKQREKRNLEEDQVIISNKKRKLNHPTESLKEMREQCGERIIDTFITWLRRNHKSFDYLVLFGTGFTMEITPKWKLHVDYNDIYKNASETFEDVEFGSWLYGNQAKYKKRIEDILGCESFSIFFIEEASMRKKNLDQTVLWPACEELGQTRNIKETKVYRIIFVFK